MNTDTLYELLQSLTKSEKRYFKLFCSRQEGDKAYWQLYEIIMQEKGNNQQVKRAFKDTNSKALFEPARKHLYQMLMKALRSYHAQKSIHQKLHNLLQDIEILFSKGLVHIGFAQLEKVKNLAWEYEKFSYYVLACQLELQYLTELEFMGLDEASLVAIQEKINDTLYHQLFINKHASLYQILLHRYFHQGHTRSRQENEGLNDLLLEEYQVNATKRYHSFESTKLHLHFQATYFLMTGQYEESLKEYLQLKQVFHQHQVLWADEMVYYVYLIDGILTGLKATGKYATMKEFIEELNSVSLKSAKKYNQIKQLTLSHELSILIDKGQLEEGYELVKNFETNTSLHEQSIPSQSLTLLSFYSAVIYFGLMRYADALKYINRALNAKTIYISRQHYSLYRLLHLILHFELNNTDYLSYEVRSVERKLKTEKKFFKVEKVLLTFFKSYSKASWQKNLLPDLHKQLVQLSQDPYEVQLLRSFDFISWVESRLRKVSFMQVLKEKAASAVEV